MKDFLNDGEIVNFPSGNEVSDKGIYSFSAFFLSACVVPVWERCDEQGTHNLGAGHRQITGQPCYCVPSFKIGCF